VLDVLRQLRGRRTVFYSTHILDDVQQVSDQVAILKDGVLMAQAPLREILAAGKSRVFSLCLEGDARQAQARVASQAWVTRLTAAPDGDQTCWEIEVTDEAAAQSQLFRLILEDENIRITQFRRKQSELEDVFVRIIKQGVNAG
jgi:ABC-2 type transport system ATP-binding protein